MSHSSRLFASVHSLCILSLIACCACPNHAKAESSPRLEVRGKKSEDAGRPQRRRRGPLPDWAKQSWFIRRQMDTPLCLKNVHVVNVRDGSIRSNVNVVIQGDQVRSIGSEPVPDNARVVDCAGGYLIPGLFDLHAHVMPKWDIFPTSKEPEETLKLLLDSGVTTIRAIPLYSESALLWSARVNSGELRGPTIIPTSSVFEKEPQRTSRGFGDSETVRQWVRKEALLGSRWIKVYDQMDEESLAAIVESAAQFGMRVCGHASKVPPHRAAQIGLATVEHLIGIAYSAVQDDVVAPPDLVGLTNAAWYWRHVDAEKCRTLMDVFKKNGTGWVPTLVPSR